MKVKGMAFLARRDEVVKRYGEERWKTFIREYAQEDPYFEKKILPSSLIPAEHFLPFIDKFVEVFHSGDENAYWEIGREGANWALIEGPYQSIRKEGSVEKFFEEKLHLLWNLYFTEGKVKEAKCENNICRAVVINVPFRHKYLEYSVMGFVERAMELISGKKVEVKRIKSLMDDGIIEYEFVVK